jgi:hypothetical protein
VPHRKARHGRVHPRRSQAGRHPLRGEALLGRSGSPRADVAL